MRLISRHLLVAGVVLVGLAAFLDLEWLQTYRYPVAAPDFFVYYLAARIGSSQGWAAIYDPAVLLPAETAVVGRPLPYLNPPELAWLVLPLTALPYAFAAWIWRGLLATAFAVTWLVAAPGDRLSKIGCGLAGAVLLPVVMSVAFGQVSLLIIAIVAIALWLLRAKHPWLAGLVLAAVFLKPQAAFLVPIGLLLSGQLRTFVAWLAATTVLAALAVLAAGVRALVNIVTAIGVAQQVPGPTQMSLLRQLPLPLGLMSVVLAIAIFMVLAIRCRGSRPEVAVAVGLIASMLVSPYLNVYDLSGLVLAAWLVVGTNPPRWLRTVSVGIFVPIFLAPIAPLLSLVCVSGWLVTLLAISTTTTSRNAIAPAGIAA